MAQRYDYSGLAGSFGRMGDQISAHVMRLPAIRHQLQMEAMNAAERNAVNQARIDNERAQAENYRASSRKGNAEAANIEAQGSAAQQLGDFLRKYAHGGTNDDGSMTFTIDPQGVGEIAASAAQAGKSASDSLGAVGKLATTIRAPGEAKATRQAAAARNQASVDARSNTALEIARMGSTAAASPGSAIYDKRTGKIIGQVPSAAGARELFDTETTIYPKVDSMPAVPATTNWLGKVTPGLPAVAGEPERRVTRRLPRATAPEPTAPPSPLSAAEVLGSMGVERPAFTEEADNYPDEPASSEAPPVASAQVTRGTLPQVQSQADIDEVLRQANLAIQNGKDPALVRERLKAMGIALKE